jgi:hypothetical protein
MFDLIMLGLVLAGVVAISRAPAPKQEAETPQRPASDVWTPQTDWRRFHKPTYLRRGVVPGSGQARSTRHGGQRMSVPKPAFGPDEGEAR